MTAATSGARLALIALLAAPAIGKAQVGAQAVATTQATCSRGNERAFLDCLLRRGRADSGLRVNPQALRVTYANRIRNPFQQLLVRADSLRLTDAQADSIAVLNRSYARAVDAVWSPVAEALATLPDRFDLDHAVGLVTRGAELSVAQLRSKGPAAFGLLTPAQRAMIPQTVRVNIDPACLAVFDPFTSTTAPSC